MTVVVEYQNKYLSITKGAPDIIISRSENINQDKLLNINKKMGSSALCVLGLGIKEISQIPNNLETLEQNLHFIGLVGMIDPQREEVHAAIKLAKSAGVKTIMITGNQYHHRKSDSGEVAYP